MEMSLENRLKMHQNYLNKLQFELITAHQFQIALVRVLERRFPGLVDIIIDEAERLGEAARAEDLREEALSADALVRQLEIAFDLPAND